MRPKDACQLVVAALVLLACTAEARIFLPREGRFLSPDRAGMVEGPNVYQYVQSQPTMRRDPTGQFSDIDPELPLFNEAFLAAVWINTEITLWDLRQRPCWITDWDTVKQKLTTAVTEKDITLGYNPAVWQKRAAGWRALPAFNDPDRPIIWLTPAAGHLSIVSPDGIEWEPTSVPTPSGFKHITSWIGLLGHELTHEAGYSGTTGFTETLANQVGIFLESQNPNYLPLDPTPYNAGTRPAWTP